MKISPNSLLAVYRNGIVFVSNLAEIYFISDLITIGYASFFAVSNAAKLKRHEISAKFFHNQK